MVISLIFCIIFIFIFLSCVSTVCIVYIIISPLNWYLYIHWILDYNNQYYHYNLNSIYGRTFGYTFVGLYWVNSRSHLLMGSVIGRRQIAHSVIILGN